VELKFGNFSGIFRKGKMEQKERHSIGKPTYFNVVVFIVETDCGLCEVRAAARDRFNNLKYDCKVAEERDKWRAVVSKVMNLRAA
jgi:hypothetical protein